MLDFTNVNIKVQLMESGKYKVGEEVEGRNYRYYCPFIRSEKGMMSRDTVEKDLNIFKSYNRNKIMM